MHGVRYMPTVRGAPHIEHKRTPCAGCFQAHVSTGAQIPTGGRRTIPETRVCKLARLPRPDEYCEWVSASAGMETLSAEAPSGSVGMIPHAESTY